MIEDRGAPIHNETSYAQPADRKTISRKVVSFRIQIIDDDRVHLSFKKQRGRKWKADC